MPQPNTWYFYRATVVPMQLFILVTCGVFYYSMHAPWLAVLVLFLVMQVGLVVGAVWGAALHRRRVRRDQMLPLERRL